MTFSRFHFIFLYFWITKRQKLAHHKFRFSRKEGAVFWDTFPRGVRIPTLWKSKVYHFFSNISDHYKQILVIIQVHRLTNMHRIVDSPFLLHYFDFSRQMSKIWSGPMSRERYISRFGTGPNSIEPWSLHMSRSRFDPDLFGTERYRLHNQNLVRTVVR